MAEVAERLDQARAAAASGAWPQAYALLTEVDVSELSDPEELETLGEVAWWTGRADESVDARTRAFAARLERGEEAAAALLALKIGRELEHKRSPLANAWLARAERLLADKHETTAYGHLVRTRARVALRDSDYDRALQLAEETLAIGTRDGDRNLMALALHDKGTVLVRQGRVEEGLSLLDESTVAAVSGELDPYTTAVVYCGIIAACRDLGDFARAGDWTEAAKRWCERQAISGFPGLCRVNRAEVMRLRGRWPEAEEEIHKAVDELYDFAPDIAGYAFYELGELQLRMGDLAAAEQAFREAHGLGAEPQPGLALLRLARGEKAAAEKSIRRALDGKTDRLQRARLLPARVEIALEAGDVEAARAGAEELASIAEDYGSATMRAWASIAAGLVALAGEDVPAALRELRAGVRMLHEQDAPYEAARGRILLSEAYKRDGDEDGAELELRTAIATFERLGAARDARLARDAFAAISGAATERTDRTFLFTDIVDSTPLVHAIGDEAWGSLVAWHDRTLRALFAEHGGEEVDHAGDGFFVAFRDAQSAANCAAAIQRSLAEHRREAGFAPQVRAGIHAAAAGQAASGYFGKGVHEAARIGGLAGGGEIVASRATAELLTGFDLSEPRTAELKGIADPIELVTIRRL